MNVLQHKESTSQPDLVRLLGITASAWGLTTAWPSKVTQKPGKPAPNPVELMPMFHNWAAVPVQSLRWAI
jgi:hypothetical protein